MIQARKLLCTAAALLVAVMATSAANAGGASVDTATKAQLKEATELYERGVAAMDAEKYVDAIEQFQRSYDTVNSPNSRMMVGRALVKMGKLPEAYRELSLTLKQALELAATQKKYKKTVETAQKELDDIKNQLAYVTIRQDTQLQLQGQNIPPQNWSEPQPVTPGTIPVEVTFADGSKLSKQLVLKPGEHSQLDVNPPASVAALPVTQGTQPPPAAAVAERSVPMMERRTVGYVFGAVGIVGIGAFVGLSLIAAPSYGNSKAGCTALGCPEAGIDNETPKSTLRGMGYAGLGIGIVGLGVGTLLVLTGGASAPTTSMRVSPAGLQLTRRF